MTLTLELPPIPDSWFGRFDPRWKLAAILSSILTVVLLHGPAPVVTAFLATLLLILLTRLPLRWYVERVALTLPLLIGLLTCLPFLLHDGANFAQLGPIRVSLHGFLVACRVTLKILSIVNLVVALIATTPMPALLKASHALHIPGLLIQLTSLTWRYLFLVIEEFGRIRTALRVRGYRPRVRPHNYRVVGHVTGTLLVRSAERAERVGQAMRCRGYDGSFRAVADFRTTWRDVLQFLAIMITAAVLVLWQWWSRYP